MQALPFRPVGTGFSHRNERMREFRKSAGFSKEGANQVSSKNSCVMIARENVERMAHFRLILLFVLPTMINGLFLYFEKMFLN